MNFTGTAASASDLLTIFLIMGSNTLEQLLKILAGIGSSIHDLMAEAPRKFSSSSIVAGENSINSGTEVVLVQGVIVGGETKLSLIEII